ncbi:MAG TPA: di-heme oxidoredictase family protein [Polyangiaceae bacterium]|nr:di-heme oxidoredictase family protein [Polyangiaceae bacterium]
MERRNAGLASVCWALSLTGAAACGSPDDASLGNGVLDDQVDTTAQGVTLGGHLSGISDADFADFQTSFANVETVDDGLGPIFNDRACGNCHDLGAAGGAGDAIERRFGRFDKGVFNPLANEGGSLRQLQTLGMWTNNKGQACNVPLEVEPADATVHNVGRMTTPLFGLGLVDAMPDSFFTGLAKSEASSIRGTANVVNIVLPNPSDSSQSIGSQRVGRFGWKAGVPTLVQFSADAYMNEMGITTQHCINGTSVTAFSTESAPNGIPVAPNCEDNVPGVDDQVGACAKGQTTIQDDVSDFTQFMTFLAPPPSGSSTRSDATDTTTAATNNSSGQNIYDNVGCGGCHTRQTFTTPRRPANGVPGNFAFKPYSDFLVHDMGSLGDQIGNAGDSQATTRLMRTAPLWGVRFRDKLLHDGRATSIPTAIADHAGQGANAATAFGRLSSRDQNSLVQFVLSL